MAEDTKFDTLIPRSLLTPEYLEWSKRERDALLVDFNDPDNPAGDVARAVVAATWPVIDEMNLRWDEDDSDGAREEFILAVQRFVNGTVAMYRVTLKE